MLAWLLAGADALSSCNLDDRALVARALESLPDDLYDEARRRIIEGKVHRWAGAVSGQPGGCPLARRELGTSAGAGRASGTCRGRRLPVRFDTERRASLRTVSPPTCCATVSAFSSPLELACESSPHLDNPPRLLHNRGLTPLLMPRRKTRREYVGPAGSTAGCGARSAGIRTWSMDRPAGGGARRARAPLASAAVARRG